MKNTQEFSDKQLREFASLVKQFESIHGKRFMALDVASPRDSIIGPYIFRTITHTKSNPLESPQAVIDEYERAYGACIENGYLPQLSH